MSAPAAFRVFHCTAELWPYARTGGLGQAVAGLAAGQARGGLDVSILLPLYREAREHAPDLVAACEPFPVRLGAASHDIRCWQPADAADGPRVLFVDHPASFDRAGIYGEGGSDYADNDRRFALFSLAAIEIVARLGAGRALLHAHDWHAALAPVYLRLAYAGHRALDAVPAVLSVHNGGFQGLFDRETLDRIGLPAALWSLDAMEWYGRLNYLKGGLTYADMVTTVSPTHAAEICTEVGGFGLHDTFHGLGDRLVGIRNGIDDVQWDPATDPVIEARYRADDLAGKPVCKAALQRAWLLPQRPEVPVFGMSARLVAQKGLDLIVPSDSLRHADAQFVFLGAGEARYEAALHDLARAYPDRVAVNTAFTDRLEHRLLAGADFLLMPSLYEPCGLTQMRAQLYGALPLARRVGGLADTITDDETGFLFDEYDPAGFDRAVRRALDVYAHPARLAAFRRAAMRRDFSWDGPVGQYAAVYRRAFAAR